MLTSSDVDALNHPLHSAVDHFNTLYLTRDEGIPDFVKQAFQCVRDHDDLALKRFTWLILLRCCPSIDVYVQSTAINKDRHTHFMTWLADEIERLARGSYAGFEYPIKEFVAAAVITFNSV